VKISLIGSVKDEVARINGKKPPLVPIDSTGIIPYFRREIPEEQETPQEPRAPSFPHRQRAESSGSNVSEASSARRARKGDIYTLASEEQILAIVTEIDAGRFVSNTKCAPWTRGQKHHPNSPETFKVRRHLSLTGSQTKESISSALPDIDDKFLVSILHELREQGIVTVKNKN
jgi:hypothetical protein